MISAHFHVHLTDGSVESGVSVLLIHVVHVGSGLIFNDDSEGFNVSWLSFEDFVYRENLSLSALGLEKSSQMIPELRLGDDVAPCEESQCIDFGLGVLFSGGFSTHYEELPNLKY